MPTVLPPIPRRWRSLSGENSTGLLLPASPALPIGQPSFELPTLVRWSEVVPGQRGDLNNLILGLRLNEQGQLSPLNISLYELFHTIAAASSGWGKSAFLSAILAQLATCPDQSN
ncbi:MAG: hypothetical protein HS126_03350 [Anaerolineales bacterium]|nr:hypothetical protein [Anaerolineales bacterium]